VIDFDKDLGAQADAVIAQYPHARSAVMPLLHLVQASQRVISPAAVEWIAGKLNLQPINVWELVTFYPAFGETVRGKVHIRVCHTLSCELAGAEKTGEIISRELGVNFGQTRADGAVSLEWTECLACCDKGPAVMVGDKLYTQVTPDKAVAFANSLGIPDPKGAPAK
jgi:NADH-quinone oxidoreductase subunit E